ncbi:MAG: lipopolysaccharide biosynthesis protein [Butyrivibrio sp.]|nr:lipopolysaccharide biosynthesis protein [Butyrivibrio sp.]
MSDSLKQKTVRGASWSFVEQILARGVNFVIGIILARLLSPTEYGLVGMLGIFIAISQLFIDGGLTSALIRTKNPSEKDFSTVYLINMGLSVVFYFLLFFAAPLIADFYKQPLLKPLARAIALVFVIGSISSIQGTLLTIRVDFKTKTIISLASSIISGVTGILCAYKGLGVWALVAQTLTSAATASILTLLFVRWIPKLVFSKDSFNRLFSYSSKLLAASLVSTIYDNAYPLVIGKRFTAADVGQFSRAGQFPGTANSIIVGALNRVAFPVLSQVQDEDELLLRVYEKYLQLSCFIIFPLLMGICGCARPLVSILLKDQWLECVPLMQILCFGLLTNGITIINLNLLYVKGRTDLVLRLEMIKKSIAFFILFVSMFFNIRIICYGQVLYCFIALFLNTHYTKKILKYPFSEQMKAVIPYFILSLMVLAESLLFSFFIDNDYLVLGFSSLMGAFSYIYLAKTFHLYAYLECKELIMNWIVTHTHRHI